MYNIVFDMPSNIFYYILGNKKVKFVWVIWCFMVIFIILFDKNWQRKSDNPITRTKLIQSWLVQFGSDLVKKFHEPKPNQPIKIDWFGFIFSQNPVQINPIIPLILLGLIKSSFILSYVWNGS